MRGRLPWSEIGGVHGFVALSSQTRRLIRPAFRSQIDHRHASIDAGCMDLRHLSWPFFDSSCIELAAGFKRWVRAELGGFEQDEGGDGKAARLIFERLAAAGWLRNTLPKQACGDRCKVALRHVSLMREMSAFSSAIADVALSEPWLGILPVALYGSQDLRAELLPRYLAGKLLPAFALSEPDAGSDAAAITTTAYRAGDHYVINGRKHQRFRRTLQEIHHELHLRRQPQSVTFGAVQ
jgi:hypothetical protein